MEQGKFLQVKSPGAVCPGEVSPGEQVRFLQEMQFGTGEVSPAVSCWDAKMRDCQQLDVPNCTWRLCLLGCHLQKLHLEDSNRQQLYLPNCIWRLEERRTKNLFRNRSLLRQDARLFAQQKLAQTRCVPNCMWRL